MTPKRIFLYFVCAAAALNGILLILEVRSTPAERAAQVIAAEAAGEGLPAMIAVGEVIRARGSFRGFSVMSKDLPAVFAAESRATRFKARLSWALSRLRLLSGGATHFENVRLFGRPVWSKGMTLTARWAGLEFYRKSAPWDLLSGKIKI